MHVLVWIFYVQWKVLDVTLVLQFIIKCFYLCFQNDSIDPREFTLEKFLTFYYHLCGRSEIDDIFAEM